MWMYCSSRINSRFELTPHSGESVFRRTNPAYSFCSIFNGSRVVLGVEQRQTPFLNVSRAEQFDGEVVGGAKPTFSKDPFFIDFQFARKKCFFVESGVSSNAMKYRELILLVLTSMVTAQDQNIGFPQDRWHADSGIRWDVAARRVIWVVGNNVFPGGSVVYFLLHTFR